MSNNGYFQEARGYADRLFHWLKVDDVVVEKDLIDQDAGGYADAYVNGLTDNERLAIDEYVKSQIAYLPTGKQAYADSIFFGFVLPEHRYDDVAELAAAFGLNGDGEGEGTGKANCPALPIDTLSDSSIGTGAGGWIDAYVEHARAVSPMTPDLFHEGAALFLGSTAIARRLKLPMSWGNVYPNLYQKWLAATTLWRKTTALDVARGMARSCFPHLLAPQDITPEGFLSDLAGREPAYFDALTEQDQALWRRERNFAAQRGLILDEMSGLLAAAGKDYNAGLIEALLRFYDCDNLYTRSTRGQGRLVVRNAYLSLLGASTPAAMAFALNSDRLWSMGWWPRFALLTPETERPAWVISTGAGDPPVKGLQALYARLPEPTWPDPPEVTDVILGAGVFETWQRYAKAVSYDVLRPDLVDRQLWGTYGRLPAQSLKVAVILAALDWQGAGSPVIQLPHLVRALAICEKWRASAHRAIQDVATSDFSRIRQRIMRQLSKCEPDGATLREVYRAMSDKDPADVEKAILHLVNMSEVEEMDIKPGKKGGRRTKRYRLVRG